MKVRHRADMPVNSNLIVRAPTGEDVMRMLRELHLPLLPQLYPPKSFRLGMRLPPSQREILSSIVCAVLLSNTM